MRVTSKGQVTIPLEIRERLGIQPGSDVDFQVIGGTVQLVRRSPGHGAQIVQALRGRRPDASLSTDQIMALSRGAAE